MTRIYIGTNVLLNQQNKILGAERMTIAGIDEVKKILDLECGMIQKITQKE